MKAGILAIASGLVAAATICGCAVADPATEQRSTAIAIGGNAVAPEQINISNQTYTTEKNILIQHWHASAPIGEYDCTAVQGEKWLEQTVCVKK